MWWALLGSAFAVGPCFFPSHGTRLVGWSDKYQQLAVEHTFGFCTDDSNEHSYEVVLLKVYTAESRLKRVFSWEVSVPEGQGDGDPLATFREAMETRGGYRFDLPELQREVLERSLIEAHLEDGSFELPAAPGLRNQDARREAFATQGSCKAFFDGAFLVVTRDDAPIWTEKIAAGEDISSLDLSWIPSAKGLVLAYEVTTGWGPDRLSDVGAHVTRAPALAPCFGE